MASNGGTLHGVPQPIHQPSPPGGFTCSHCGLLFDSGASLQVHMHYHHEQQQQQQTNAQWQSPSSTHSGNNSPTLDHANAGSQEGNNHNHLKHTKCISPPAAAMNGSSNTIAAADSSDNQPSTPSSMENGQQRYPGHDLGYYQQAAYEQHYQAQYPTPGGDYPGSTTASNNLMMQPPHEYKSASSARYHPYGSPVNSHAQQTANNSSPSTTTTTLNAASPRLVSSSSPSHQHNQHLGQPTPSPSPKQCDKCGLVCPTASELNEHYVTAHATTGGDFAGTNTPNYPPFGAAPVKEEPQCDILDLDSQKMVYPPHQNNNDPSLVNNNSNSEGPLPSMQSLHTIQRHHPVMWQPTGHDMYNMQQQQQQQQRSEYGMMSPTIPAPAQTHLSSSPSSGGVPSIKSEYMGMSSGDIKPFDQSSSITTSPSDFPSTTTPQDSNNNNTGGQFRNFEPPTSSLPSAISSGKSTAWKSNEARRPKTYNCTACNKWFTSSGHLKRHYNTTLHKNAVKASNQPDPATMPISVHHHPARDPNSKHHRNNNGGPVGNTHPPPQPQPPPTDPQRSPDYAPQFAVSSAAAGAYPNVASGAAHHHNQGFQQYSASLHSNAAIPPNGQAGPSVHASLPRGLLTYSNHHMEVQPQPQVQVLQHHIISSDTHTTASSNSTMPPHQLERDPLSISPTPDITTTHHLSPSTITTTQQLTPIISTSMEPPLLLPPGYISSPLDTTTTITSPPLSRLEAIPQQLSYHTIIGSQGQEELHQLQPVQADNTDGLLMTNAHHQQDDQGGRLTLLAPSYTEYAVSSSANETYTIRVLSNPQDIGDTAPYSPSMPHDPYRQQEPLPGMSAAGFQPRITYMQQPVDVMMPLPKLAETAPDMCSSPGSPSVTSSDTVLMEQKHRVQMPKQEGGVVQMEFIKDGVKRYECVQCDKTFNKSCYLTQHNKTFHSGDKPFKCHRCGKRFSCEESHEEHVAKHSGDKPFKCELCPKAFNHKTDLRRHMCLHSGRKPFHCDQCGKGFIRKDHLVKHMDVHTRKAEQIKRKLEQQQQPGDKSGKIKLEAAYDDEEDSMSLMM